MAPTLNRSLHIVGGSIAVPLNVIIAFPHTEAWITLAWLAVMGGFAGYGIYRWAWL